MAQNHKATVLSSSTMTKRFAFGMKQKITTLMLVMSMLPILVLWAVDYNAASTQIERSVDEQMQRFVDLHASAIDRFIDENVHAANLVANMPGMGSMNPLLQKPMLQNLRTSYEWLSTSFVADLSGQQTVRDNDFPLNTVHDQPFATAVLNGSSPYTVVVLQSDTTGETSMVISVPILGANATTGRKQIVGLLSTVIPTSILARYVGNGGYGQTGYSYVLDEQGRVVMHKNVALENHQQDFSQQPTFLDRPKMAGQWVVSTFDDNGHTVLAATEKTRQGWFFVTQVNTEEVYAPLADSRRQGLFLLAMFLIIAVAVSVATGNAFSRPIAKVALMAETMANDSNLPNKKYKIPGLGRKDEIGELAQALEKMYLSLKTSMRLLRREE